MTETDITVRLLPTDHLPTILPLVRVLNPALAPDLLAARLTEMTGQGYQCTGAYLGEKLVGICGLWVATRFYCGKYIEPDNVVVDPDYRSLGVGQALMAWVYAYARELGCEVCELNSYVVSPRAHKFYFNEGFAVLGFHFQKRLEAEQTLRAD